MGHQGKQVSVHLPMDDEKDLSICPLSRQIGLAVGGDHGKIGIGRKQGPKALNHGGGQWVDQQDFRHEKPLLLSRQTEHHYLRRGAEL
jgi:hypothetical protein